MNAETMHKKFGRVAVLLGGDSAEREISLQSGEAVYHALKARGVDASLIDTHEHDIATLGDFDRAFIALHGRGGEDGTVQGVLEYLGVPYTGSGVLASALAMDKIRSKQLWNGIGLPTPEFYLVNNKDEALKLAEKVNYPLIFKPSKEGSSIGMSKVENKSEFLPAYEEAEKYDQVLMERWITGAEYTVAIVGKSALPAIKLETENIFYDYEAKYKSNDTKYICPCGLSKQELNEIEHLALESFKSLGCKGWGRVDFMRDDKGQFYLLEVNTVPGMTSHSLVPMAAKEAGMSFENLVLNILEQTLDKAG